MERRLLLKVAAGSAAVAVPGGNALAAVPRRGTRGLPEPRRLTLRHAATGHRFSGAYYNGLTYDPAALGDVSQVLADSRTGAVRAFDPRALDILWEVLRRAGVGGEALIFSGYRTPETNAAVHGAGDSEHLRASAVDLHVPPAQIERVGTTALTLARGGVGIYGSRGFIHLDSGAVRRWGDIPGNPAAATAARAQPQDPLARMAEAWAATRRR